MNQPHAIKAVRIQGDLYRVKYSGDDCTTYSEVTNWKGAVAIARKVDADEIHVNRRAFLGEGESPFEIVRRAGGFVQTFKAEA
jgi:hypothetical protein